MTDDWKLLEHEALVERTRKLVESTALVRSVMHNVPAAIAYVDAERRYQYVNRAFLEWGYGTEGDVVGRRMTAVLGAEFYESIRPHVDRVLAGEDVRYEVERDHGDGVTRFVQASYVPDRNGEGGVCGFFALLSDITSQKRAERRAAESEARYRALVDQANDGIAVADEATGEILEVNQRMLDLTGRRVDELVGQAQAILHPPEDEQVYSEMFERHVREATGLEHAVIRHADGYDVPVEISAKTLVLDGRRVNQGLFRDISSRKISEEALRASEERYRTLAESASEQIFIVDDDLGLVYANRAAGEALGRSVQDIVGRHLAELFPPDDAAGLRLMIEAIFAGGKTSMWESGFGQGVEDVWIQARLAPIHDPDGRVSMVLGIARDVTTEHHALDALRISEERFKLLVERLPVGVCIVRQQRFLYTNPRLREILGMSEKAFETARPEQFIVEDADSQINDLADRLRTGDDSVISSVERLRAPNGKELLVALTGTVVPLPDGPALLYIGVDVTREEELKASLIRTQKMQALGTLAGGIAHDFNNLLTGISSHAGLIRAGFVEEGLPTDDIDGILRLQERGAALTEKLLALGRRQMIRPISLDLNRLIAEFTQVAQRLIGPRHELAFHPDSELEPVTADPVGIEQVLLNLVMNARDAMPDGGLIEIETERREKSVLTVRDSGIGIPADTLERIFEPFYTSKDVGKGTGLGLAVVFGIVEQHQGHVRVESREGEGTLFVIELPVATEPVLAQEVPHSAVTSRGAETLLVAEDDENLRFLVRRVLETAGYRVFSVPDGQQAVDLWQAHRDEIDLVVFDVMMPNLGGLEAWDRIVAAQPTARGLLISGFSDDLARSDGLGAGVPEFLRKPFRNEELLAAVRRILDTGGEA